MPNLRLTALLLWAVATPAAAEQPCKVISVSDGDTITALCQDNERLKIRLAEIDAPEKAQPFGMRSKQSLSDMCFGKQVEIAKQARDRYGRTVARIQCDGTDANAEQVRRGMAWVYDKYVKDRSFYHLQDQAKAEHIGLWADDSPTPPWLWRKARR